MILDLTLLPLNEVTNLNENKKTELVKWIHEKTESNGANK